MAPPTGTMKFLSRLCTKASILPTRDPWVVNEHIVSDHMTEENTDDGSVFRDQLQVTRDYLLYEVHTFGRLDAVCIVNDVWNVIFGTHWGQFLEPITHKTRKLKADVVKSSLVLNQSAAVRSRTYEQKVLYLSGTRGAKQDVVEWMQSTFSAPSSSILRSTAPRSVRSSSPSTTFSTTTGSKPEQTARCEREDSGGPEPGVFNMAGRQDVQGASQVFVCEKLCHSLNTSQACEQDVRVSGQTGSWVSRHLLWSWLWSRTFGRCEAKWCSGPWVWCGGGSGNTVSSSSLLPWEQQSS